MFHKICFGSYNFAGCSHPFEIRVKYFSTKNIVRMCGHNLRFKLADVPLSV